MHTLRTRFKKEIVCEFLPPSRPSDKVIIFCGGMPSVPSHKNLLEFFSKKGYWVFYPRYRGTWESEGEFLKKSPEQDILDVITELPKGFVSLWDGKKYKVDFKKLYIIGSSFGGPAAILLSRDVRVTKSVALYPVVDWTAPSKDEPMDWLETFVQQAFGQAYRFSKKNWKELSQGKMYQPVNHIAELDGGKLFVIHAKDDATVLYKPVEKFAKAVGAKLWLLPKGGHGGWDITEKKFYNKIKQFFKDR